MRVAIVYAVEKGGPIQTCEGEERRIRCEFLAEKLKERGHTVVISRMPLPSRDITEDAPWQDPRAELASPLMYPVLAADTGGVLFRDVGNSPGSSWWRLPAEIPGKIFYSIGYEDYSKDAHYANLRFLLRRGAKEANCGLKWAIVPYQEREKHLASERFPAFDAVNPPKEALKWSWQDYATRIALSKRVIAPWGTFAFMGALYGKKVTIIPSNWTQRWQKWRYGQGENLRSELFARETLGADRFVRVFEKLGRRCDSLQAARDAGVDASIPFKETAE